MKKNIFLVLAIMLVAVSSKAAVYMNDFETGFPPPDNNEIGDSMIDGSSNFISSYSAAAMLLYEREIAERNPFNIEKSLDYAETAISKLELSRSCYLHAVTLASKTEYIPYRINQLKNFDYDKFCAERNLNTLLMDEVKQYLSNGDVLGIYRKNLEYVEETLTILYEIRELLKVGKTPDITIYWNLLRKFSTTILFGNYATSSAKKAFSVE